MLTSIFKSTHKGKAQKCQQCDVQFKQNINILTNVVVHQCKRCNKYICINCGPEDKKMKISGYKDNKAHRVCSSCYQDKHFITYTLLDPNTTDWMGSIKQINEQITFQYNKSIQDYQNKNPEFFKKMLAQQISNIPIREKFNASIQEYLHTMQSGLSANFLGTQIYNIKLWAINMKYPDSQSYPEFDNLILILLALTKQQVKAAFCTIRLVRDILPPNFLPSNNNNQGNQVPSGQEMLSCIVTNMIVCNEQVFQNFLTINQQQKDKLLSFLSKYLIQYFIRPFMIPLVNSGIFFLFMDQILRGGLIDPFIKAIICVIKINLGNIVFSDTAPSMDQICMTSMALTTDLFKKEMITFDQKVPNFQQQKTIYIQQQMQKSNPQQQPQNLPQQQNHNEYNNSNSSYNQRNSVPINHNNNVNNNVNNNNNMSEYINQRQSVPSNNNNSSSSFRETVDVLTEEEQALLKKLESVTLNRDEFNKNSVKGDICINNKNLFDNEQLVDERKIAEIIKNTASYTLTVNDITGDLQSLQPTKEKRQHYQNIAYQVGGNQGYY